jgi:pilus assembly protein CpaE
MGSSMIATQSALMLGEASVRRNERVALLDFDFQFGTAALYLDLDAKVGIDEVLEAPDRLDAAFLQAVMGHHKKGVDVLPAARTLVPLEAMTPDLAGAVLRAAAHAYPYVFVDLPRLRSGWTNEILQVADMAVLVTQLTVPGIRHARRQLDALGADAIGAKIVLVVNRYQKQWWHDGVRLREAEQALGRSIDHFIGNDYRTVSEALNQGVSLGEVKSRSRVERHIRSLVEGMQLQLRREPKAAIALHAYR